MEYIHIKQQFSHKIFKVAIIIGTEMFWMVKQDEFIKQNMFFLYNILIILVLHIQYIALK